MKTYVFFFFLLIYISINAQNETINWYFGNKAALNFDRARLKVLNDSEMDTPAGSASISNEDGLLMFYSDGTTVWNRNHEIMENGSGLAGDNNNFQSAIIIPKPGNDNIYYLFYSRLEKSIDPLVTAGAFYSEIEFNTASPLGKVIRKNAFLDSSSPSEKLTAIHHKDGENFWLITVTGKDNDPENLKTIFKVYAITNDIFTTNAVRTEIDFGIAGLGSMKISADGTKLLVASKSFDDRVRYVHYFNFDNETGKISFNRNLIIDPPFANWPPKGLEISPNGQFVYVSFDAGNSNGLFQFEIEGPGAQDDPRAILFFGSDILIESLQLANDQKIYVALTFENDDSNFLGVINNPNEKGIRSNYVHLSTPELTPGASKSGLPNFIQSYFASKINTKNQCYIDPFTFSSESYAPISNAVWDFGDGNSGSGITTNHTYNAPGEYTVKGVLTVGSKKITVYKLVEAYALPSLVSNQELAECDEDYDGLSTFNLNSIKPKITNISLNETLIFYLSPDDLNNDNPIINNENFQNTVPNQEIFVKVINQNGCFETTSFTVSARFVSLGTISDFYTCESSDGISGNQIGNFNGRAIATSIKDQLGISDRTSLKFYSSYLEAQTNTNELTGAFSSKTATIFVKAQEADFSCGGIQSFNVIVNADLKINLEETYQICVNPSVKPPVIISADATNDRYEWRNSQGNVVSISENFTLDTIGEFSLTVYKSENGLLCSNSKTFLVENPEKATFSNIDVNTEDETNNIVTVSIDGNSTYEFSLDNVTFTGNSSTFTFNNVEAGLRTIYARDINNCEEPILTEVAVIGFKEYFTPNNDGKNDYWNINGLDETSFKSINVRIFDRYGKLIHQITNFTSLGWDGTYNSEKLIANNYWFKADIIDKDNNLISKTGNFSLIRN